MGEDVFGEETLERHQKYKREINARDVDLRVTHDIGDHQLQRGHASAPKAQDDTKPETLLAITDRGDSLDSVEARGLRKIVCVAGG